MKFNPVLSYLSKVPRLDVTKVTAVSEPRSAHVIKNLIDNDFLTFFATSDPPAHTPPLLWIQLHLSGSFIVYQVVIFNGFSDRILNIAKTQKILVKVGSVQIDSYASTKTQKEQLNQNSLCATWPKVARSGERIEMRCTSTAIGKLVSIEITKPQTGNETQVLELAEVEVYGKGKIKYGYYAMLSSII